VSAVALQSLTERVGAEYSAVAARLPAQVVSSARRESALRRFVALGLPHLRDDQWRYANLRPVERARFASTTVGAQAELRVALPQPLPGMPRLIFVNGHYVPALSSPGALPPGARILPLATAGAGRGDELGGADFSADERFAWLNEAFAEDGALLQIEGHASLELLFVTQPVASAGAAPTAAYPRLQVVLRAGAQLCLVERHLGGAGPQGLIDATAQLRLEAGSHCAHYRVQVCERDALFLDSLVAQVGADADYRLTQLALGAGAARSSLRVQLDGARASTILRAVTLADAQRVLDTAFTVEHNAQATRSEQVFRAIANSRARIGMLSRVRVGAQAQGSDCRQSLRGLIAAEQAEIDLRPELEINTDEVQASHGATTGALDDTALFYLLSRGLDRDTARLLLEWAFLEDVLAHVQLPALRAQVERATVEGMGRADKLGELL
jgi:Fe-S cluster assembly protein SufD